MLTADKENNYIKTLPLLILVAILIANPHIHVACREPEISIPLYKPPNIDGTISAGEYPVNQIDYTWVKLYAVHDSNKIVFGIVLIDDCKRLEILFNTGTPEATSISVSTLRYAVNRSGTIEYYYGAGGKWVSSPVENVPLKVSNKTTTWVIELSIPLESINVYPNIERKLGFALIALGKTANYSWPLEASLYNPSTWGVISSPDNWATKNDISLEVYLNGESIIAGSNVTLIALITNAGDAPIPDYLIQIWLDSQLIENSTASKLGLKTPLEKSEQIRYEKNITNIAVGNHMVKVNVTGIGVFYDFNYKNNFGSKSLSAKYAKIEVLGTPGVSISLNGNNQTISEEGNIILESTAGVKKISTEEVYNPSEGLRYVFVEWRYGSSVFKTREISIDVKGDLTLELEHRKEYLVKLSFVDKDNNPIEPSFYECIFPNNTRYNGTLNNLWLTSGSLSIISVGYAGMNVLEEIKKYDLYGSEEIIIQCNVLSGTIRVVDPFSTPVSGAEVSVTFLNGTSKKYVTDSNGAIDLKKVGKGKAKLTISHMGYSTVLDIDFSKEREVTIKIPVSLNTLLIVVAAISIVVVVVLKIFSHKIFGKEKRRAQVTREEYEFEEI